MSYLIRIRVYSLCFSYTFNGYNNNDYKTEVWIKGYTLFQGKIKKEVWVFSHEETLTLTLMKKIKQDLKDYKMITNKYIKNNRIKSLS